MSSTSRRASSVLLTVLLCSSFFPSCTTTRVVSKYECNTIANNPVNQKTTWAFFWGLLQPTDINPSCEPAFNHLNKVETRTNLGFALITVATVGIVIPQQVRWCCAPQEIPTDTLGVARKK
ncbi:MAG: hypothetical protein ACXWV5_13310 [Flavitalea sp.]